jgi:hypothetical protein
LLLSMKYCRLHQVQVLLPVPVLPQALHPASLPVPGPPHTQYRLPCKKPMLLQLRLLTTSFLNPPHPIFLG